MTSRADSENQPSDATFERLLLESARDDAAPDFEPAFERLRSSLELAAISTGVAATRFSVDAARKLAARWALVGAVVGGAATGLIFAATARPQPPSPTWRVEAPAIPSAVANVPTPLASAAVPRPAESTAPNGVVKRRMPRTAAPAVTAPSVAAPAAPEESTLIAEVALLDAVRGKLAQRDGQGALGLLAGYQQKFPHGQLARDAAALSIEALAAQGSRAEAERRAASFLAESPDDPQASKVRSLQER